MWITDYSGRLNPERDSEAPKHQKHLFYNSTSDTRFRQTSTLQTQTSTPLRVCTARLPFVTSPSERFTSKGVYIFLTQRLVHQSLQRSENQNKLNNASVLSPCGCYLLTYISFHYSMIEMCRLQVWSANQVTRRLQVSLKLIQKLF